MPESITRVDSTGFYAGQNRWVAIAVKVRVVSLVLWASLASDAGTILMDTQSGTIGYFGGWYVYASAVFMVMSLVLALVPRTGSIRLGADHEKPEFSRFAWFSMMFGAGIGVGMLTYSTAEPSHTLPIIPTSLWAPPRHWSGTTSRPPINGLFSTMV